MTNTNTKTFFGSLGLDMTAGEAYFKPTGRPQRITIRSVDVCAPNTTKKLPEKLGGKLVPIYAVLHVERAGAPMVWEVSSKRAIDALNNALQADQPLPVEVLVSTAGERENTTYRVSLAPADVAKPQKGWKGPCDAPGCAKESGHDGRHMSSAALASAPVATPPLEG